MSPGKSEDRNRFEEDWQDAGLSPEQQAVFVNQLRGALQRGDTARMRPIIPQLGPRVIGSMMAEFAEDGREEELLLLIEAGASPQWGDSIGYTPLMIAAGKGDFGLVDELLHLGADVNHGDEDGRTPLLAAVQGGNLEIVKRLVEAGADYRPPLAKPLLEAATELGHKPIKHFLMGQIRAAYEAYLAERNQGGGSPPTASAAPARASTPAPAPAPAPAAPKPRSAAPAAPTATPAPSRPVESSNIDATRPGFRSENPVKGPATPGATTPPTPPNPTSAGATSAFAPIGTPIAASNKLEHTFDSSWGPDVDNSMNAVGLDDLEAEADHEVPPAVAPASPEEMGGWDWGDSEIAPLPPQLGKLAGGVLPPDSELIPPPKSSAKAPAKTGARGSAPEPPVVTPTSLDSGAEEWDWDLAEENAAKPTPAEPDPFEEAEALVEEPINQTYRLPEDLDDSWDLSVPGSSFTGAPDPEDSENSNLEFPAEAAASYLPTPSSLPESAQDSFFGSFPPEPDEPLRKISAGPLADQEDSWGEELDEPYAANLPDDFDEELPPELPDDLDDLDSAELQAGFADQDMMAELDESVELDEEPNAELAADEFDNELDESLLNEAAPPAPAPRSATVRDTAAPLPNADSSAQASSDSPQRLMQELAAKLQQPQITPNLDAIFDPVDIAFPEEIPVEGKRKQRPAAPPPPLASEKAGIAYPKEMPKPFGSSPADETPPTNTNPALEAEEFPEFPEDLPEAIVAPIPVERRRPKPPLAEPAVPEAPASDAADSSRLWPQTAAHFDMDESDWQMHSANYESGENLSLQSDNELPLELSEGEVPSHLPELDDSYNDADDLEADEPQLDASQSLLLREDEAVFRSEEPSSSDQDFLALLKRPEDEISFVEPLALAEQQFAEDDHLLPTYDEDEDEGEVEPQYLNPEEEDDYVSSEAEAAVTDFFHKSDMDSLNRAAPMAAVDTNADDDMEDDYDESAEYDEAELIAESEYDDEAFDSVENAPVAADEEEAAEWTPDGDGYGDEDEDEFLADDDSLANLEPVDSSAELTGFAAMTPAVEADAADDMVPEEPPPFWEEMEADADADAIDAEFLEEEEEVAGWDGSQTMQLEAQAVSALRSMPVTPSAGAEEEPLPVAAAESKSAPFDSRLHQAVWNGDMVQVQLLLDEGVNVNQQEPDGFTALMNAVCQRNLPMILLLCKAGADLDLRNEAGQTALDIAAERKMSDVINALILAQVEATRRETAKMLQSLQETMGGSATPSKPLPRPTAEELQQAAPKPKPPAPTPPAPAAEPPASGIRSSTKISKPTSTPATPPPAAPAPRPTQVSGRHRIPAEARAGESRPAAVESGTESPSRSATRRPSPPAPAPAPPAAATPPAAASDVRRSQTGVRRPAAAPNPPTPPPAAGDPARTPPSGVRSSANSGRRPPATTAANSASSSSASSASGASKSAVAKSATNLPAKRPRPPADVAASNRTQPQATAPTDPPSSLSRSPSRRAGQRPPAQAEPADVPAAKTPPTPSPAPSGTRTPSPAPKPPASETRPPASKANSPTARSSSPPPATPATRVSGKHQIPAPATPATRVSGKHQIPAPPPPEPEPPRVEFRPEDDFEPDGWDDELPTSHEAPPADAGRSAITPPRYEEDEDEDDFEQEAFSAPMSWHGTTPNDPGTASEDEDADLSIHLLPELDVPWMDQRRVELISKLLQQNGFKPVGDFTVEEWPELHLRGLVHSGNSVYAILCEEQGRGVWLDLITPYEDDSVLVYTNSHGLLDLPDRPNAMKIRLPGTAPLDLYQAMLLERPAQTTRRINADSFAADYERIAAEEAAWEASFEEE